MKTARKVGFGLACWALGFSPAFAQDFWNTDAVPEINDTPGIVEPAVTVAGPQSVAEYCAYRGRAGAVRDLLANNPAAQLYFLNFLGPLRTGVCWWHSRFTRNAAYLVYFQPQLPVPTKAEAIKLIHRIRLGNDVVMIPGYASLQAFSRDWEQEIKREIGNWEVSESIWHGGWQKGLIGESSEPAEALSARMDSLYAQVVASDLVVFAMLQEPGLAAHAWLIVDMAPTAQGYDLRVVDSNYAQTQTYSYSRGVTTLPYFGLSGMHFVPYVQFDAELPVFDEAAESFCKDR